MRICVCVDGSNNSIRALNFTLGNIMQRGRDELHLIMIVPRETLLEKIMDPFQLTQVAETNLKAFGDAKMEVYAEICRTADSNDVEGTQRGLKFESHVIVADRDLKEELVHQAEVHCIDLLIVGARGLSTLQRMVMGSVSEYCTTHAKCNVLVVRGEDSSSVL